MNKIIFFCFALFFKENGYSQENQDRYIETRVKFEVLCNKISIEKKIHIDFVVKITNYSKSIIKAPTIFIVTPLGDSEGNIGFELDYFNTDTIRLSNSIGIDMVPPDTLYKKKTELRFNDTFLKEISLPYVDFSKSGKYRIRFCLKGRFIEPTTTNIYSDWYYFTL